MRSLICTARSIRKLVLAAFTVTMLASTVQAQSGQRLRGYVPTGVSASRFEGRAPRDLRLNLAIGLPLRNREQLAYLLEQLYDPASPVFHQYLTSEEFTNKFGPTTADYKALTDFCQGQGLTIAATHPNRVILDVTGEAAAIERAFHVNLLSYRHPVRGAFFAPDQEPALDTNVPVLHISGLDNFEVPKPMEMHALRAALASGATGSGPGGLFIGKDFRAAYAPGVALTGAGQVVGLFEADEFYASDVQANFHLAGVRPVPIETMLVDGFAGIPHAQNIEVTLDIMMAAYMAPGCNARPSFGQDGVLCGTETG